MQFKNWSSDNKQDDVLDSPKNGNWVECSRLWQNQELCDLPNEQKQQENRTSTDKKNDEWR